MRKRDFVILAFALALAILAGAGVFFSGSVETAGWGLHFSEAGSPPTGNEGMDTLAAYSAAYRADTEEKVLYLTFDAGYENGVTEKILDTLLCHQVSAAFFLVGDYLERNPDLVRRMVSEGHIVGNHTMNHPDMSSLLTYEAFSSELQGVEGLFQEITGQSLPKFYRPPQGIYSRENLNMAQALGYRTVFWSLAYVDWNNDAQPSREDAFDTLLPRTHPGAIVLLHSTSQTNGEILGELIEKWKAMGYRFGTLEEVFPAG